MIDAARFIGSRWSRHDASPAGKDVSIQDKSYRAEETASTRNLPSLPFWLLTPFLRFIELDKVYELTGFGICLKQSQGPTDYAESAEVSLSIDGAEWGAPVAVFDGAVTRKVVYKRFAAPTRAKFVKVVIIRSEGWPGLNELELYAH